MSGGPEDFNVLAKGPVPVPNKDHTGMVIEYYSDQGGLVVIKESDFNRLVEDQKFLHALQGAGVDNWDGYDYAQELMDEG